MELGFKPQTELEYYLVIEELGGMRWSIEHDLSHPERHKYTDEQRIKGSSQVVDLYELQTKLVNELKEKFGVIPPNEEVSESQRAYWDWYKEMKVQYNTMVYKKDICYLCPFKGNEEYLIHNPNAINCNKINGGGTKRHGICSLMFCNDVKYENLLDMIKAESDKSGLDKFDKRYRTYQFMNELDCISREVKDINGWCNHIYNGSYGTTPDERISYLEDNVEKITTMVSSGRVLFEGNTILIGIIDSMIKECNSIKKYIEDEKRFLGKEIEISHKEMMITNSTEIAGLTDKLQSAIWDSI